jgi:diguanylate cyclase
MNSNPTPPTAGSGAPGSVAQVAKGALRRIALAKLEPTPENYARAYALEMGDGKLRPTERSQAQPGPADDTAPQLAALIERVVRGVERGGRVWTLARKKDSLQRVLEGSRSDAVRLKQRLAQLLTSWETDNPDVAVDAIESEAELPGAILAPRGSAEPAGAVVANLPPEPAPAGRTDPAWNKVLDSLSAALLDALPDGDAENRRLGQLIETVATQLRANGATPALADQLTQACQAAQRALAHRHHLVDQLGSLCHELTASLADLAESDSWAKGQCEAMRNTLQSGITARSVKAVAELLRSTRQRQGDLRAEREHARDALKVLINRMLGELGELGSQTGRFHDNVGRYTDVIEKADTLEDLTLVVREMVEESRTVQGLVAQTQARLHEEHAKATGLTQRVTQLESELLRLSNEVTTDQLTQVANRRGLLKAYEVEHARMHRNNGGLAIGLLDIDNFKRLNDEHGHAVGDEALKALAALVSKTLRTTDVVARYGGEEFVVLMPETPLDQAQQTLTRLQRSLSGGLFLNEQKEMLVTFSAGVTACRQGERIEEALERADQALYEAKRAGKNRTCIG